jgi:hypothetical protein
VGSGGTASVAPTAQQECRRWALRALCPAPGAACTGVAVDAYLRALRPHGADINACMTGRRDARPHCLVGRCWTSRSASRRSRPSCSSSCAPPPPPPARPWRSAWRSAMSTLWTQCGEGRGGGTLACALAVRGRKGLGRNLEGAQPAAQASALGAHAQARVPSETSHSPLALCAHCCLYDHHTGSYLVCRSPACALCKVSPVGAQGGGWLGAVAARGGRGAAGRVHGGAATTGGQLARVRLAHRPLPRLLPVDPPPPRPRHLRLTPVAFSSLDVHSPCRCSHGARAPCRCLPWAGDSRRRLARPEL